MLKEIEVAAEWWANSLQSHMTSVEAKLMRAKLKEALHDKYYGHWYDEDPMRGSGYRAILVDSQHIDTILSNVLYHATNKSSGRTQRLLAELPKSIVMFVNPGRVTLKQLIVPNNVVNLYCKTATSDVNNNNSNKNKQQAIFA